MIAVRALRPSPACYYLGLYLELPCRPTVEFDVPALVGNLQRRYLRGIGKLHLVGYLAVLVLLLAAGGAAVSGINIVRDHYTHTVDVTDALNASVLDQIRLLDDQETGLRGYLLTGQASYLQPYNAAAGKISGLRARSLTLARAESGTMPLVAAVVGAGDRWQSWATQVLASTRLSGAALLAQQNVGKQLFDGQRAAVAQLTAFLSATRERAHRQSDNAMTQALWVVGILISIAAISMAVVNWLVTRAVSLPLHALGQAARRVGDGELEEPIIVRGTVEFETMAARMDQMRIKLRQSMSELQALNGDLASRSAELQIANKELEAFSYSVSHDLRAPLRAINGFSRIVSDESGSLLPEEGRRYLQLVIDSAAHMGRLIDDLLSFSRVNRQELVRQEVDMSELARQVIGDMAPARVDVDAMPSCRGDRGLLRQVWVNLISNACKYSRTRPEPMVTVGGSRTGNEQVYWVRDNGVGFDMRYASKLFGVFQRLHRVEDFEGTGVGLAIVQRIVQRHRGRVWAEGAVNEGATFFFTIREEEAL